MNSSPFSHRTPLSARKHHYEVNRCSLVRTPYPSSARIERLRLLDDLREASVQPHLGIWLNNNKTRKIKARLLKDEETRIKVAEDFNQHSQDQSSFPKISRTNKSISRHDSSNTNYQLLEHTCCYI